MTHNQVKTIEPPVQQEENRDINKNKPVKPKSKFWKNTKRTFLVMIASFLSIFLVGGWTFALGVNNTEIPEKPSELTDKSPITIYASDGKTQLAELYPQEGVREVIPNDFIPDDVKNALVAAEDSSFWVNPGFDPKRIVSAGLKHLSGDSSAGGASTITQQYTKNTLVGDDISIKRKWKEVLASTRLTAAWEKDDIISSYLNTVYFGRGSTGIQKAAFAYFGIPASQLNLAQSAFLAGVVQSPSVHDPAVNEESAHERFDYVVSQMKRRGYVDENQLVEFPETIPPAPQNQSTGIFGENGHIVKMVKDELTKNGFTENQLFVMGADIITTIDPRVQESVVRNTKGAADFNGIRMSSAAVEPKTGAIRGIYGGSDGQGFDYATNPQMTGSTFKVFTLASALEQGIGLDAPFSSAPYWADGIELNNSGGMTCGTCSMAEATKQSLNTSFYRIQDALKNGALDTREMAKRLGVEESLEDENGFVAKSITLGSYPTSMLSMSHALATIANGGVKNDTFIVEKVITRNNNLVYKNNPNPRRVIEPHVARDVDTALAPIPAYSNGNQLGNGKQGYGKTGTVQLGDTGQNRDAIMVGYTRNLALSVWCGTDQGDPLVDASGAMIWGAGIPASTWKNILTEVG